MNIKGMDDPAENRALRISEKQEHSNGKCIRIDVYSIWKYAIIQHQVEKTKTGKTKQRAKSLKLPQEDIVMGAIKVDMAQEKKKLQELIANDEAARKAYDEFQAKVAYQEQLIQIRKLLESRKK